MKSNEANNRSSREIALEERYPRERREAGPETSSGTQKIPMHEKRANYKRPQ